MRLSDTAKDKGMKELGRERRIPFFNRRMQSLKLASHDGFVEYEKLENSAEDFLFDY